MHRTLLALVGHVAAAPLAASSPLTQEPAPPQIAGVVWSQGCGAHETDDGRTIALGPDYKAFFEAGSFEMVPAFGSEAPRSYPVRYALESVSVGGTTFYESDAGVVPERDGLTVAYEHEGGLIERYETRADGLYQSFVFHELPPETEGELVVRGRVTTDAVPMHDERGFAFRTAGLGGVAWGEVLGIDARGATASGEVRWRDDALELVLPGDFVAQAELPLTLDPLVGPVFDLPAVGWDESNPEVAYDVSNDVYLVVWERAFSVLDYDVRGMRISPSGEQVGSLVGIASDSDLEFSPVVANVNLTDQFVVAWRSGSVFPPFTLEYRGFDAATDQQSPKHSLASDVDSVDACSESSLLDDDCLLVYEDGTNIWATRIEAPGPGEVEPGSSYYLTGDPANTAPRISAGGGAGPHLVAWQRFYEGSPGDHDIRVMLLARNGPPISSAQSLHGTVGPDERSPACDGDGANFVVVYERGDDLNDPNDKLFAQTLIWNGSYFHVGPEQELGSGDVNYPTVAYDGETFAVAWARELVGEGSYYMKLRTVTSNECAACEASIFIDAASSGDVGTVSIASQYAAGGTSDESFIVFEDIDTSNGDGDLRGAFLTSPGSYEDLGGGCGIGGRATAPCARDDQTNFAHILLDANPSAPAYLFLGLEQAEIPCGGCTLSVDPFAGFVFPAITDTGGRATVPMSLNADVSLVGLTFIDQWAVVGEGACSFTGTDFSNAIRVTIEA